ncbi:DNA cytosine methyltransferase [Sinanaerobacter chloroacetimidivorans]|uniref:DNA cytosine methyltransferase n=1 Tax=Sinanaerobacter chloroacetimidivorans TaxID=2818044 RepID=UPI0029CA19D5|nr:DNA cytosine methyltransferase [Sinanaerobacter chloroacetimidivorans]
MIISSVLSWLSRYRDNQDLSVAGKRAGLQGERSGLFMEQIRIVKEMRAYDKANGRTADAVRPRYMVWENVPGAFSSADGEDFRAVLEETCRIADSTVSVPRPTGGVWQSAGAILGPQFSVAWRIYDAQYWSVPQRRKRIFLVADFGGRTAPQILFEQDRLFGDSAPGEETRQGAAFCSETGAGDPGGNPANSGGTSGESLTPWDVQSRRIYEEDGVWPSLYGGEGGGHGYVSAEKNKQITIPINTQIAMRHKRMGEGTGLGIGENGDPAFTLQAAHSHAVFSTQVESNTSVAFACNQRDEVRDLNNVAGAIQAQPGMKQQTFIVDSADITTFHINQRDEIIDLHGISGALLATCNMQMQTFVSESVLCLNDQGGSVMDVSHNVTGTLRARMDGHPPLVLGNDPELFENHGIDSRYTGPHEVAPTMSARYGTGGNNVPLISQPSVFLADSGEESSPAETYCIAGNIIDRQDHNGGNGMGFQPDISYTLNTADRHCVFSQQRSDEYASNNVVSTQSARQYKDATDLVCETDVAGLDCRNGTENGNLSGTLQSKTDGGYSLNNVHPVRIGKLIRRLTPLECERLQGFPDYWTDIPGASDSARYKALGNSVAIPCVEHVLRGIAYFLRKFKQEWEESECIPTSTPTT